MLLAGAACVWLALGRAALASRVGAGEAEARRAGEELVRAEARGAEEKRSAQGEMAGLQGQIDERARLLAERGGDLARLEQQLESERELFAEKARDLEERRQDDLKRVAEINAQFENTFKALAQNALTQSQKQFLELAEQRSRAQQAEGQAQIEASKKAVDELVKPIGETLKKTEERLASIEKARTESFATLTEQISASGRASEMLRAETGKLVNALRKPQVRGAYGNIQLERVAELAGMRNYCDFAREESVRDDEGRLLRPDMTINMPSQRVIVIDAKTNIGAYMEALEVDSEVEKEACLERFAGHVCDQVAKLSAKAYWEQFEKTPEFVVMFVPGDQFIDAALQRRPELFEEASSKRVIFASPSTLIGLLRAVELGWKEQRLASEAEELRKLGTELQERAVKAWELAAELGLSIERTVKRYNDFVGSVEVRLSPTLRKFEEAGVSSGKNVPELPELTVGVRLFEGSRTGEDT